MNPIVKDQWVKALRSGHYPQTYGALRTEGGFCPLGVLCDLYDSYCWIRKPSAQAMASKFPLYAAVAVVEANEATVSGNVAYFYKGKWRSLPENVQQWAGLTSDDPWLRDGTVLYECDFRRRSFAEIADLIENHL